MSKLAAQSGVQSERRRIEDLPSLRDMELFVTVVQAGNFSAAGRRFGLSPASVSRYINALEDRMGVRLLNRTSRKLSLSDMGTIFYQRAERILNDVRETQIEVTQEHVRPQGVLHVHSRLLVGLQYIAPALPTFLQQYPEISVDFTLSNEDIDIVENNIDVDIRIGTLADSSLIARKLVTSERILCATPDYLAARPKIKTPDDLLAHNCLTYRINLGGVTWRFLAEDGALTEVAVQGSLRTNNGPALHVAMMQGLGLSLMPDWAVAQELASGQLVRVLPDYRISFTSFENAVYAVYSPTKHLPVKARVFIDFLAKHFQTVSI
ncbi:LysR family transcriptional regulator [Devosia sp. MC532]|uniref:LysR family transcriptional regulator n=1 Tax=Devosia sp. MC532 TaxID=2799788 RepID=UPI0018F31A12|nr:LysR family transcriptional regulator [Devosia sp. MC532]MBJ7577843.1 LysR family transcriptional regulator [Devosia sp. MC532]